MRDPTAITLEEPLKPIPICDQFEDEDRETEPAFITDDGSEPPDGPSDIQPLDFPDEPELEYRGVTITLPLGQIPSGYMARKARTGLHSTLKLSPEASELLLQVSQGLQAEQRELKSGQQIRTVDHALHWILERLSDRKVQR